LHCPPGRKRQNLAEAVDIEKPQMDHREYRAVLLKNGIRAVVISDSKCDKAAAALSVKVGSVFDPPDVPGLAHFLEHMLFLGTEKYPKEDEYNEFLAKHGGMSNAYTAESVTNYYFGVSPDHLEGALDRFSQFFIAPLFSESATDRELKAVDSEHSKNQQSDAWRWNQLLKSDANPRHPLCHFGTGNSETLKTIPEAAGNPVRKRLLEFHEKYYSANQMCVAILGKQSLAELEALVHSHFDLVVNKDVVIPDGPDIGGGELAFCTESWPRMVRVIPVRDVRSVAFQFVLPQQSPMRWRTKPNRYLSFLIGHEGKGSLLSALKAQGLATELSAGASFDDAGACIFSVGVQLTEDGESNIRLVGENVFTYVRQMQQLPVSEELFKEMQCIEEMNFRFRSVGNQVSTVSGLSHALQDNLPVDKILSGPAKLWEMDPAQILEVAACLTCANLRLAWASKSFSDEQCPDSERWYSTRYGAGALAEDWHAAWEAARLGSGDGLSDADAGSKLGLALPRPNPFVAEHIDLKLRPEGGCGKYPTLLKPLPASLSNVLSSAASAATATAVNEGRLLQAYFRQDDTFDLPKSCLNVEIYCPWIAQSMEHRVITSAWCQVVTEELNELSYDADQAGLFYSLSSGSRSLSLRFAGYQDKLPVLLKTTVDKMAAMDKISEGTWSLVYTMLLRNSRNAAKNRQPYQQASELEGVCTHRTATTSVENLKFVEALTREKLDGVCKRLLGNCYAEVLMQGNVTQEEVGSTLESLKPVLQPSTPVSSIPPLAAAALPDGPGSCVLIRQVGSNPDEKNGAVTVSLQASEDSLAAVALCELTSQVLSQRCFDELRTKQQLGYIVAFQPYADTSLGGGFCGLKVIVQSEKHPAEVHRRIDAWLAHALAGLTDKEQLSDEKVSEYLEALLTLKREKPKKLADEFGRNWAEVRSRHFNFARRNEVISFLERPTAEVLQEFRSFVQDKLVSAPRIAVQVLGSAAAAAADVEGSEAAAEALPYASTGKVLESMEDIEEFRSSLIWRESNTAIC